MSATVPTQEQFDALLDRVEALEAQLATAPPQTPEWLTIPAAATYLGRSEQAVRKLIDRHHIPKHQEIRGGRIMLRRDELDAALSDGRRPR